MVNSKNVFNEVFNRISLNESKNEIQRIVYVLLEHAAAITQTDILSEKLIAEPEWSLLQSIIDRINNHEPIHYIFGEQYFYGRKFYVTPAVLVPRPETELLITEVLAYCKSFPTVPLKLLDIGTGSGCIPVTLALEHNNLEVSGMDISEDALKVAQENATHHHISVQFFQGDILTKSLDEKFDVIISNPPYVTEAERNEMKPNVLNFEPHQALFVPDENPLLFYKAIVNAGKKAFTKNGFIAFEINEQFGIEIKNLLIQNDFTAVKIIKDYFGKDRVVTGRYENHN